VAHQAAADLALGAPLVGASGDVGAEWWSMRLVAIVHSAQLPWRSPPRLRRWRRVFYNDLLWHLHDLWPEQTFPGCGLLSKTWTSTIGRRLARAEQTARIRIARDERDCPTFCV
jgi:hypothetical protein